MRVTQRMPHGAEGKTGLIKAPENCNLLYKQYCPKYLASFPEHPTTARNPAYQSFYLLHFTLHYCVTLYKLRVQALHKLQALYSTPRTKGCMQSRVPSFGKRYLVLVQALKSPLERLIQ